MKTMSRLKTGYVGATLAAVCCFTPALVFLFGMLGLTTWLGWIDYVLFPALFASMGLIAHGLYLRAGHVGIKPEGFILVAVLSLTALLFWLEFRFALRISITAAAAVALYAYYLRCAAAKQFNSSS